MFVCQKLIFRLMALPHRARAGVVYHPLHNAWLWDPNKNQPGNPLRQQAAVWDCLNYRRQPVARPVFRLRFQQRYNHRPVYVSVPGFHIVCLSIESSSWFSKPTALVDAKTDFKLIVLADILSDSSPVNSFFLQEPDINRMIINPK